MVQRKKKQLPNVLVVCHGNICRSPLVGVVLIAQGFPVRSRGFVNPGKLAAKKVREYAEGIGLDLSTHRSTLVSLRDVKWADEILYMDGGNLKRIREKFGDISCTCLASYVHLTRIPDPNYMKRGRGLEETLETIVEASKKFCVETKKPAG